MPLTPMRFKDYVWPHNPRTYSISYRRAVASDKVPFQHYYMQDLGLDYRVLSGEGEFSGADAYDEFKRLAAVFYDPGAGTLIHPVWQPAQAYFVALELTQEPRSDYIAYRFEFWEDTARHTPGTYAAGDAAEPHSPPAGGGSGSTGGGTPNSPTGGSTTPAPPSPSASTAKTHTVREGETLVTIAAAHGTTPAAIIRVNPNVRPAGGLASGTVLRLE